MPLPKPRKGEKQSEFVGRCVSFVKKEDSNTPNEQATAMCYTQWRNKQAAEDMLLEYFVPIEESVEIDGDFLIKGIAINETTTSNGHTFVSEELEKSAKTLVNVPLLKDHKNEVDSIVGRVKSAFFDENIKAIPFKAIVKDIKMKQMIKDGLINSVSVGAHVDPNDIEETEEGTIIPHNITFKELSLVAIPADAGATFSVALNNAWKGFKSDSPSEIINTDERGTQEQMSEEVTKEPQEEPKEEVEAPAEAEAEPKPEEPTKEVEELKKRLAILEKKLAKLKESDADEAKAEPEPKPEPEKETEKEEEEEAEEVEEKAGYKIVQGHRSFTLVKDNYRQRLVA